MDAAEVYWCLGFELVGVVVVEFREEAIGIGIGETIKGYEGREVV